MATGGRGGVASMELAPVTTLAPRDHRPQVPVFI